MGRALTLSNGKTEITVTLDVGPRIIGLKLKDGFNIMYEDVSDAVNKDCSSYYGEGSTWHIYGGHRLWLSPEDITTYYPDCEEVKYDLLPDGALFTPKKWRKVDVQPYLKVEFLPDNELKITHTMLNTGEDRELCLWALTVMKAGGRMTFPLSEEDTGLLANRNLVMWSYCSFKDSRFNILDDKIVLESSKEIAPAFKFGGFRRDMEASYELTENNRTVKFTKRVTGEDGAKYPDYSCNFESYCTNLIHEIESLSPMKLVKSGEKLEHVEIWKLEKAD